MVRRCAAQAGVDGDSMTSECRQRWMPRVGRLVAGAAAVTALMLSEGLLRAQPVDMSVSFQSAASNATVGTAINYVVLMGSTGSPTNVRVTVVFSLGVQVNVSTRTLNQDLAETKGVDPEIV